MVWMPGTIPGDKGPAINKTHNADTVEMLTILKLKRQIINRTQLSSEGNKKDK